MTNQRARQLRQEERADGSQSPHLRGTGRVWAAALVAPPTKQPDAEVERLSPGAGMSVNETSGEMDVVALGDAWWRPVALRLASSRFVSAARS